MNNLFEVKDAICQAITPVLNYDNDYWQNEKRINRAEMDVLLKQLPEITADDFNSLTIEDALKLGFRTWSKETPALYLIPAYLYTFIPAGLKLTSINGDVKEYKHYKDLSEDQRFGLLAYGIDIIDDSWLKEEVKQATADKLDFGTAIKAMKEGKRVMRNGWNGKGMFLYYVPENKYPATRNTLHTLDGLFEDNMVPYGAYIAMKTAQDNVVPWLASQTDMLAEDWVIII